MGKGGIPDRRKTMSGNRSGMVPGGSGETARGASGESKNK